MRQRRASFDFSGTVQFAGAIKPMNRATVPPLVDGKSSDAPVDPTLRGKVTAGFVIALLLTVFIGVSAWHGARRAEEDAYWVSHTHEVMEMIQRTARHVIEAETSARAFALTGQEPLLVHYQSARESVIQNEKELRALTADNRSQQQRLDLLDPQVSAALGFAESIIAQHRKMQVSSGNTDALETERLMDVVRATTRDMYEEETRLLIQRAQRATAGRRLTKVTAVAGVFVGGGLWILARLAVNREIDASARARAHIVTLNASLEERVQRRTAELQAEIAERKQAEAASQRVVRELADQKFALDQHGIVAATDVQGTITYVNDKFCTISQYSRAELLGQNHRILNSGHHPKEYFRQMYQTIASGKVWHGEIQNRAKDGSIYWVDTTVVPTLGPDNKPRQYVAIRTDITERKRVEEARERLAAVVESSDDAIISKTLEGTILAWNRGAEKLFGYSSSEAVGKPMLMLLPPERANEEFDILSHIRRGESVDHLETVRVRKDGKQIDISATISPMKDSSGVIVGASKIARDITDRKRAEDALRESEERFQAMANGIQQLAWMAEADGSIFWYNRRWYEYTGTTLKQMQGWGWQTVHDPSVLPDVLKGWKESIASGKPFDMEVPLRGEDGGFRVFLTRVMPVTDSNGRVVRWFGTNTDISEHKQVEERLARLLAEVALQADDLAHSRQELESQAIMLRSVLDSMAEGLVAADEQGKFILWNTAAKKIIGLGPANMPSQDWSKHYGLFMADMVTPFPPEQDPLARAVRGEAGAAVMFVRNPEPAEGVWVEAIANPLRNKDGVVHGGVVAFRDITQRGSDEREIRKLNDELEEKVVKRTAQLEAANEELEAFTYSVSHDLRAPLRHISGFAGILVEEHAPALAPEARQYLQRIQDGTQKMGRLVDELLNLARVGRQSVNLQVAGLNSIVDEVVSMLQPEIEGRQVEWRIARLPFVECDPTLMKLVFQNLISNALKYSRPRAHAVIEIGQTDGTPPAIFVRDNGVGFSMKYADKLFGVFQRLHRSEDFEGTGVGLATLQRIVKKHGGQVWAEAELDKGATFFSPLRP
jgi:PAS domain S-box-containing protein